MAPPETAPRTEKAPPPEIAPPLRAGRSRRSTALLGLVWSLAVPRTPALAPNPHLAAPPPHRPQHSPSPI
eukprot:scaffold4324_cov74-Isochrysis_galbana.AAC.1